MVGAKKRKNPEKPLPQLKIGGIYHSDIFSDNERRGHFVVVSEIISPEKVKVHVCTSSRALANNAVDAFGLLGPGERYILKNPETIDPRRITQSKHMTIPADIARQLGIILK